MKQVIFAVLLIAMATLTGCLNSNENQNSNEDLINPTDAYSPPLISTIRVDEGYQGYWEGCDGNGNSSSTTECEYRACTQQGWHDIDGDGDKEYCDIDGHQNGGPQVVVNKVGKEVSIECIKSVNNDYCKDYEYAHIIFTSIEGLREMIECDFRDTYNDNIIFHKCEATLGFEPASFEISSSEHYFDYTGDNYYFYVVFRVF